MYLYQVYDSYFWDAESGTPRSAYGIDIKSFFKSCAYISRQCDKARGYGISDSC